MLTWGEFQLRLFAYRRKQENEARLFRKVAFYSAVGPHLNYKKLPNNEVKFWQIGDEVAVHGATEAQKEKFLNAWAIYQAKAKNKA